MGCAGDSALTADEKQKLQQLMDKVVEKSKQKGLEINKRKLFVTF